MDLELDGKIALVTGSSRGIGKAIARALAEEGADVAICARHADALQATARDLTAETGRAVMPFQADMRNLGDIQRMVREALAALGDIDILVNTAARLSGTAPTSSGYQQESLEAIQEEVIIEDFETKILGYFRCAREVAPSMKQRGWGRIVNLGGLSGRYPLGISAGMRNAAVSNMTKALADDLGPSGITVNAVHPAFVRNEVAQSRLEAMARSRDITMEQAESETAGQSSINQIIDASEVSQVVAFLCSPRAACITGENIAVGGGYGSAVFS